MTREAREHAKFIRTIGHIFLWALGVVPLAVLMTVGWILMYPYVAMVSIGIGLYLIRHSKRPTTSLGEIHDR